MNDKSRDRQAVALQYTAGEAPKVTAKGEGNLAEAIIAIAEEHGVHVHSDERLAGFLAKVELGGEIPRELYLAVAQIIAFAYVLKGKFPAGKTAADYNDKPDETQ